MTEQEWLTSEDPAAMLAFLTTRPQQAAATNVRRISDRKLRLFACACCRQVWHLLTDERSRRAVEVAERFVDGEATLAELDQAHSEAYDAWGENLPTSNPAGMARYTCLSGNVVHAAKAICRPDLINSDPALVANLLRDIVGNPHRPVTLPSLSHAHVRLLPWELESLAQAAYQERGSVCPKCHGVGWTVGGDRALRVSRQDECGNCNGRRRLEDGSLNPIRLAVLADALEEAGCTDESILQHLRATLRCRLCGEQKWPPPDGGRGCDCDVRDLPGRGFISTHVRGCWALDLILGKE